MQELTDFAQQNAILIAVFAILSGIIVTVEFQRSTRKYKDINPIEMVNLMNRDDAVVLDFRSSNEAAGGTIQDAQRIAPDGLVQQMDKLSQYQQRPVIGFCSQGIKAPALCRQLTKHGFAQVYHLKGGITAWKQANMPVVAK